ncbi:MAG: MFS transporter [Phycisphaerae bacterium]
MCSEEGQEFVLEEPVSHVARRRRAAIVFLGVASAAVGFTMSLQTGLNDNFLADELFFTGAQKGLLEAVREFCGIAALGMLALLAGLAEPIIAAAMLVMLGVGLGCYAAVFPTPSGYVWLVLLSLVWSQGFHVFVPLPSSMMLSVAEPGQTGRRLGQMQAAGAIGSAVSLAIALGLAVGTKVFKHPAPPIRLMYILAGGAATLGAVACLAIPRDIKTPGPRLVFRRKYGLYYLLCLLEGWRKQIFIAFAGFLLVKVFHTELWLMLTLWLVVQSMTWFVSPAVGRIIDRFGERRVLVAYYIAVTAVNSSYALIPMLRHSHPDLTVWMLRALFIADNAFFALGMALTTYVRHIAPPSEHTPTLSMGVAMNHVAAVTMPLVGALLWQYVGYQAVFAAGAAAAVASIFVASRVPMRAAAREHKV